MDFRIRNVTKCALISLLAITLFSATITPLLFSCPVIPNSRMDYHYRLGFSIYPDLSPPPPNGVIPFKFEDRLGQEKETYGQYPYYAYAHFNDVAYDGNRIYVTGTRLHSVGGYSGAFVLCLDAVTGNQIWMSHLRPHSKGYGIEVYGSAVYLSGTLQGSFNRHDALLVCFDSSTGTQLWNTTFGGSPHDVYGYGLSAHAGSIFLGGMFEDGDSYERDAFLASFDASDGSLQWNTNFSTSDDSFGYAVTTSGDAVYLTGTSESTSGLSEMKAFLARYTLSGTQMWNTTWKKDNYTGSYSVVVNASNLYIACASSNAGVLEDPFTCHVFKFDTSGNEVWNVTYDANGINEFGADLAIDDGAIYLSGSLSWSLRDPLVDYTVGNAFLAKFDENGVQQWNVTHVTPSKDESYGVIASDGVIYVAEASITVTYPPTTDLPGEFLGYSDRSCWDLRIIRYDSTGTQQWQQQYFGKGNENFSDIELTNHGLYILGTSKNSEKGNDMWLIKYNFNGQMQWETFVDTGLNEQGYALTTSSDRIYLVGYASNDSQYLLLLSCIDPSGNELWTTTWNGAGDFLFTTSADIKFQTGRLYVTGTSYNRTAPMDSYGAFVACFDAIDGGYIWDTLWGTTMDTEGWGLDIEDSSIYVTASSYPENGSLICFDSDGNEQWNVSWGNLTYGKTVVAVSNNLVYLAGAVYYSGVYLACFNSTGDYQWDTLNSTSTTQFVHDLKVIDDTIYLVGSHQVGSTNWIILRAHNLSGVFTWDHYSYTAWDAAWTGLTGNATLLYLSGYIWNDGLIRGYGAIELIRGRLLIEVYDENSTAIENVLVEALSGPPGRPLFSGKTNSTGQLYFDPLRGGEYLVQFSHEDYYPVNHTIEVPEWGFAGVGVSLDLIIPVNGQVPPPPYWIFILGGGIAIVVVIIGYIVYRRRR